MIINFRNKATKKIFCGKYSTNLPNEIQNNALNKPRSINCAQSLNDLLSPPGNHLEKLQGKASNKYSIRINKQWRICFSYFNNNFYDVEITDYH
jgi:proteic killer suppression protein